MLKKLKDILNTYTDEEINDMDLWINSKDTADLIFIDKNSINLITNNVEVKIDGYVEQEALK